MSSINSKIVIFGGNGFIGSRIAKALSELGAEVVCISRTGHKPLQLRKADWSTKVKWCKGDAADPCSELLASCDAVVYCVGSAPLPTFSKQAYEKQLASNGTHGINTIEAAKKAGVEKLIIMSAQIPWVLKNKTFAYYVGKQQVLHATEQFCASSKQHSALILKPGAVTGIRTLANGKRIRLDWLMGPISPFMPWQFVSVKRVAERVADAFLNADLYQGKCITLKNKEI